MSLDDWSKYLPLLLVVAGWAVVNHQNNRRETRKEMRALLDSTKKATVEVARLAVAYYCDAEAEAAHEIKWSLQALEIELERLPGFDQRSRLLKKFVEFSEAATGGDFESADRPKRTRAAPEIASIQRTRNLLIAELELQFKKQYL